MLTRCNFSSQVFCWTPRKSSTSSDDGEEFSCRAKDGNPFGPFWDHVGVDEFDVSKWKVYVS